MTRPPLNRVQDLGKVFRVQSTRDKSGRGQAVKCDTLGTSAARHGALQPRRAALPHTRRRGSVRLQKAVDWRVHVVISVAALQAQDE